MPSLVIETPFQTVIPALAESAAFTKENDFPFVMTEVHNVNAESIWAWEKFTAKNTLMTGPGFLPGKLHVSPWLSRLPWTMSAFPESESGGS